MIITQLNLTDRKGGAAIAAYRLHKGLKKIGQDSYMLVRKKVSSDKKIFQIGMKEGRTNRVKTIFWSKFLQKEYINDNRSELSNSVFSLPYPGYDLTKLKILRETDIINMHWVAYFQSIVSLRKLFRTGKPVVWTLHDQWAFSGGCHYSAGCNGYIDECAVCPQLNADPHHLPQAVLRDKIEYFKDTGLTVVTPSKWLAACAKKSKLFKNLRIEVIPNSLETDRFFPISEKEAKKNAGVPEDSLTLLFVAEINSEKRKGFKELLDALHFCKKDARFKQLLQKNMIHILCLGKPSSELNRTGIPLKPLGYLKSEAKIRNAYNAADLYILSSLEDNLPNTMLEAMACGTPVVSFDVGGMPDMIKDGETGALAKNRDPEKLGGAILGLLFDPEKRQEVGINCRRLIEQKYDLQHQAENYLALYKDLIKQNRAGRGSVFTAGSIPKRASGKNGGEFEESGELNIVKLDGGLSPIVKKIFAGIVKKGIVAAVPGSTAPVRVLRALTQFVLYITPVSLIIFLYRMTPGKIKKNWQKQLKEQE
jgi:glycosyltransferase involved in cell wall biosynthesis